MSSDILIPKAKHRYEALDGLRGLAAVLVVLLHVEWLNHLTDNNFVQHGYVAVDLFFILSGFVISSNYLNSINNAKEARRFIVLRFFRLYPLHLAMLGAFVCLECAKLVANHTFGIRLGPQAPFTGDDTIGALVANLFLVNGLHVLDKPSWNGVSWSISCEFAAYLVFCVMVLTGLVRKRPFFVVGVLLTVAGYLVIALKWGNLNVTADWGIIRCLSGFFLGMLIFQYRRMNIFRQSGTVIGRCEVAVAIAVLLTMSLASGLASFFVIPLFVLAIAWLQFDQGPIARLLMSPAVQFLGRISYSIYMVHSFLVVFLLIILKRAFVLPSATSSFRGNPIIMTSPWIGDLLVIGVVALVIATASGTYSLIEEPGRLFGRRLFANAQTRIPSPQTPDDHEGKLLGPWSAIPICREIKRKGDLV